MATVVVAVGSTGTLQTSGAIPASFTASTNAIDSAAATIVAVAVTATLASGDQLILRFAESSDDTTYGYLTKQDAESELVEPIEVRIKESGTYAYYVDKRARYFRAELKGSGTASATVLCLAAADNTATGNNTWTGTNIFDDLRVRTSDVGAFDTRIRVTEVLTANRVLTLTVNNTDRTVSLTGNLTLAANFTTSGANALTLTTTAPTNVTLPTTGTLATLAGAETLSSKVLTAPDINAGTADSLTSLSVRSTGAAFDLLFACAEAIGANRTVTFAVNNADRVVTLAGDLTMSGANNLTLTTTGPTNVTLPTSGTLATQAYADALANGLDPKASCRMATNAGLAAYTRVGNVITANGNGVMADVDGITPVANDRMLLKDGAAGADNGIYVVTDIGTAGTPFVLTRATDADASAEVTAGCYTFIDQGTVNADTGFVLTTNDPITLNTTALTFSRFARLNGVSTGDSPTWTGSHDFSGATVLLPAAAVPAQTAEGSVVWDSNDDLLTVGTGAARKTMLDTDSTQTASGKTFTTPTIGDLTNATHTHLNNAGGGTLSRIGQAGRVAVNEISIASNIVEGETVTIGADVYEFEVVNTDSTDNTAGGDFNNMTNPVTVAAATYPNLPTTVGALIRIETEILRVTVFAGGNITFSRGASGTTNAAHADALDIFEGNGIAGGSTVAVGNNGTLTPAVNTPALVADINAVGTEAITATAISNNHIHLQADAVGAVATAVATTMGGVNNQVANATMYGGKAAGMQQFAIQSRVPNATEDILDAMIFEFPFTPTTVHVAVYVTATPGLIKDWDGAVTIASGRVTLGNAGATDWAVTDTVRVIAHD